ncbi:hypothetical protein [Nitrobacter sp. JJSN]|uniref:hypothetical protein n=1 Tax=Nitrobacter sp. JJSN TaxID=3453033 RepID=UPI003F75C4B2
MSEVVAAQLNPDWRITLTSDRSTGHRRAWLLQRLADGVWCDVAQVRTAETLRALVRRHAGYVDAAAAVILAALPPRVDVRVCGS